MCYNNVHWQIYYITFNNKHTMWIHNAVTDFSYTKMCLPTWVLTFAGQMYYHKEHNLLSSEYKPAASDPIARIMSHMQRSLNLHTPCMSAIMIGTPKVYAAGATVVFKIPTHADTRVHALARQHQQQRFFFEYLIVKSRHTITVLHGPAECMSLIHLICYLSARV